MIKLVYIAAKRPDISESEFYSYWLNKHAPLVLRHASTLRAKKYIQSHLIDTPEMLYTSRGMLPPLAGITEVWWDSLEDMQEAFATTEGRAAAAELTADEEKFINIGGSQVFLTEEHTIFDFTDKSALGEKSAKAVYLVKKYDDMTREACHKTWLVDHGPYVRDRAKPLDMAKYIQSHTIASEVTAKMVEGRGFDVNGLDGITEVWIADVKTMAASRQADGGEAAGKATVELIEDERRFVDLGRSRLFMTKEHVIFDYTR